ncbi:MAG: NAD-dependent DNA ligase LigA [Candidatus Omnitrophica bacterium]|nr:NAD-dependent DNA ligase LigA [Candidatus Omnitrophota bacterium]
MRLHDYLYYVISQPEISDKEYDVLIKELQELEDKHPELKTKDSPTVRVGGGILDGFKAIRHRQKMFSLDNTYSIDELKEWDARVRKDLGGRETVEYVAELKIDGVSANIAYLKGSLSLGLTRGDGESGEDVTQNIKTIRPIPLVLLNNDIPELIEIRGEIYMSLKDFIGLNKQREEEGEVAFANPRNAASGSLKLLDTAQTARRGLNFFAHSIGEYEGKRIVSQWEFLAQLKNWGVRANMHSRLCKNLDEVICFCKNWQEKRDSLGYEIDGIVVKINDFSQQKKLGSTLKSPRWAVAFKFPARQATTEVLKININVGRTGVITPTAELTPVECSGVVITRATLHNFDEIKRLNLKVGDRVLIERAGDVIPKVVKVVESKGNKSFPIPDTCPACGGKVIKEKEEDVAYRCINSSCPAQLERGLEHFASRGAMDIEGMGEAVIEQLVKLRMVKDFADIYKLSEKDLLKLELFKERKAGNLLDGIEKSKKQPLSRLIFALGIRHVGEKAALVLAGKFKDIDNLIQAKKDELQNIYEVGPVLSKSIAEYFSQASTRKLISEFKELELNLKEAAKEYRLTKLTRKTIVFTGELSGYSRARAEETARLAGAMPASTVSKNTDFVVAGENAGSKLAKAKKLGVKIIDEAKFKEMLK